MEKPIITYMFVADGKICQVMADNNLIKNIDVPCAGISLSSQELLLISIIRYCNSKYGEHKYYLPYYIGGDGYVYKDQKMLDGLLIEALYGL